MEQRFWENRYEIADTGWNIGKVSIPLKEYLDQLENKDLKILVPGCGQGFEAIYAYRLGFKNVFAMDFVEDPLSVLRANAPDFPEAQILKADFFAHEGQYDLILEQTLFCAIDLVNREAYARKVQALLAPGGRLAGVLFNRDFDSGPPFGGSAAEYQALFSRYFTSVSIEPCYNSIPPRAGSEVFVRMYK